MWSIIKYFTGNLPHIANIEDWNGQQVQKFSIFHENLTFCSLRKLLAAFVHQGINRRFFTRKKLLDRQTMHWVLCNRNLMGQTSQKMNICLNRLVIQTRFPSKQQLSEFLPWRSQSAISFLYMIQYPSPFFHPFIDNLIGLNCQKFCSQMFCNVWCFFVLKLYCIFFHSYHLHFFIKTSIDKF